MRQLKLKVVIGKVDAPQLLYKKAAAAALASTPGACHRRFAGLERLGNLAHLVARRIVAEALKEGFDRCCPRFAKPDLHHVLIAGAGHCQCNARLRPSGSLLGH